MSRLLLGVAAVVLLPTAVSAQNPSRPLPPSSPGLAAGVGLFRPGIMGTPAPFYFNRGLVGFGGGYGYSPFVDQFYAPYTSYFGYGYGLAPFYGLPGAFAYDQPVVEFIPPQSAPTHIVELSSEYPATLTMDFPAAAKVWLDGKEVAGEAAKERVLNSPVLKAGQTYTFKVRATWDVNGKTYEYTRDVTLGPGDKSKLMVMAGTPVAQK